MHYQHTQIGYLMIVVTLAVVLLYWWILMQAEFEPVMVWFMLGIVFLVASFTTLKVTIDKHFLWVKFGWGIFRKRFSVKDVVSAATVKNHWYYGWGIRFWPKPKMMIMNVSGFEAVEIILTNGKRYRLGTDEPGQLKNAIDRAIGNN